MKKLHAIAMAISLTTFSTVSFADNDDHKSTVAKVMAGANIFETQNTAADELTTESVALATYGIGIEYEFTPTLGMELRHYFGGEQKELSHEKSNSVASDTVSLNSATTLLFNVQSPDYMGLSAYLQGGPAIVKNDFNGEDYSNTSIAYGAGIEYQTGENTLVFLDALQFNEYDIKSVDAKSVKNRMVMLGFAMQF